MSTIDQEQRILEVARELFTTRGFSNVAIRDICKAASVTPPTVYYYFRNKEALFDAVVRKSVSLTEFITQLKEECRKTGESKTQIRAFVHTYLSNFPKERLNVGLYVRHSTELDSIGRNTLLTELGQIQSFLTSVIRKGIEAREFRKTDPKMAAECLLGMMNRLVFQQIHFSRNYKPSEASAYVSDFFLKAMKL